MPSSRRSGSIIPASANNVSLRACRLCRHFSRNLLGHPSQSFPKGAKNWRHSLPPAARAVLRPPRLRPSLRDALHHGSHNDWTPCRETFCFVSACDNAADSDKTAGPKATRGSSHFVTLPLRVLCSFVDAPRCVLRAALARQPIQRPIKVILLVERRRGLTHPPPHAAAPSAPPTSATRPGRCAPTSRTDSVCFPSRCPTPVMLNWSASCINANKTPKISPLVISADQPSNSPFTKRASSPQSLRAPDWSDWRSSGRNRRQNPGKFLSLESKMLCDAPFSANWSKGGGLFWNRSAFLAKLN